MEEVQRARCAREGCGAPRPSLGTALSQHLHLFTNPEALWTLYFRGFLWRFHYGGVTDKIHWPFTIKLNSQPLSPPWRSEVEGWGWKFQPSNHLIGSPTDQSPSCGYPGAFQKSPPWHKFRCGWKGLVMNNKTLPSPFSLWSYFRNWSYLRAKDQIL